MKLIVQIPCLNEEATLAETLADIPRDVAGFRTVEVLVIDDGCTDRTVDVALASGADHVLRFTQNRGLAEAFCAGLQRCLALGADAIVHTDADNQYRGDCIADLVAPIVDGSADLVVGVRPIEEIDDFSWLKKKLQRLGSWAVRQVSRTEIDDVTSGFRAYSREAAMRLTVVSGYTYTLETLIQAGRTNIAIAQVPIRTNRKTRESRLFRSIPEYIARSVGTILRIYTLYRPMAFFSWISAMLFLGAGAIGARFLYYWFTVGGAGHIQSLILCAVLAIMGFQCLVLGVIADLIAANRKLVQDLTYQVRSGQCGDERPSSAE